MTSLRTSLLERGAQGPYLLDSGGIDELNRVFSDAFTDRYQRDGMAGVRVPHLNPEVWRFAIAAAGEGAMCWRNADQQLIAFNLVHASGVEGWMGPLAVRPDFQGVGLGQEMVQIGIDVLKSRGCRIIGLETMPRTVDNIGFYSRMGFRPQHLTVSMVLELSKGAGSPAPLASAIGNPDRWLDQCQSLTDQVCRGVSYKAEIVLTLDRRLGDVTVIRKPDGWRAFALWQSAALAAGRAAEELRVLKLVACDRAAFREVVNGVIDAAVKVRCRRVSIRCQTAFDTAYSDLLEMGFQVHWTDLRMTLRGYDQPPAPGGAVLFSNWEI